MDVREFDFDLPPELIAQEPPRERGASRLLHLNRASGSIAHTCVSALPDLLREGDLVVVNDTRVFPARLIGRRVPSGGAVECLLVRRVPASPASDSGSEPVRSAFGAGSEPVRSAFGAGSEPVRSAFGARSEYVRSTFGARSESDSVVWETLVHPGQKLKPGARVVFEGIHTIHGEILERRFFGRRLIRLWTDDGSPLDAAIDAIGHVPLPPYIKRIDSPADRERYQTVFARARGSIAAPTAGLHFTPALLVALRARGVDVAAITLHVGYGTFQPVRVARVEEHSIEPEEYEIGAAAAAALERARADRRRVVAVGTTTTRTLEHAARAHGGAIVPGRGTTDLFIYPGFEFRLVGGLLTNFHLPRSSLLMLVAAFAGAERIRAAYDAAVAEKYRFYSYGDAMLIL
jgi:S-adenosylmethionine:tRNA ribosyltransferase-isomerase